VPKKKREKTIKKKGNAEKSPRIHAIESVTPSREKMKRGELGGAKKKKGGEGEQAKRGAREGYLKPKGFWQEKRKSAIY